MNRRQLTLVGILLLCLMPIIGAAAPRLSLPI
ncbi:hypothetical protein EDD52_103312 [Primorskyibacter sedentarius]|uniref:Uncharacterized protein n=1 Tax=Primorskyibacter sedentarius TaxID=745311 RepID=A0A4R3JKK3_9RHOB|nr:hypothetical protein EDD52_103312 [Primorskyibacter sedentarius]